MMGHTLPRLDATPSATCSTPTLLRPHATTASPKLPRRYVRLAAVRGGGGLTSTPPRPPPTNPTTNNSGPKKYLFEPRHGLPVVRETLDLGGLLRAIRSESVSRIYWFTQRGVDLLEGPCLIVYKDGTVKKSYVPPHSGSARIFYAMETHGVMGQRLVAQPTKDMLVKPWRPQQHHIDLFTKIIPALGIAGVLGAAKYAAWKKGDADDRALLRAKSLEKKKAEKREARVLEFRMEVEQLAQAPEITVDAIMSHLSMYRQEEAKLDRAEVEEIVKEARKSGPSAELRAWQAAQRTKESGTYVATTEDAAERKAAAAARAAERAASEDSQDDVAKGKAFGRMNTTKISRAKTKAAAKKRLKLQHGEENEKIVTFADVVGQGDAKEEVVEVVDFFRNPDKFKKSGARVPRGVLLCGPPGTGKTLLGRAVAGEAEVDFLCVNASEFVEMFVGVGASRVRDLFATAKKLAPCIVFIDEIDAVGRVRGGAKGNDERDQTLNQMLSCMDGFDADAGVIVMAATNRRDVLDPALVRPGRFDRIVYVDKPDFESRIEIFKVHLADKPHDQSMDLREIAFVTQQFTGAMIASLVNLSATMAYRAGREQITYKDVMAALEYERLGAPRAMESLEQRRRMAVQEGATALAASLLPSLEVVEECTVVPREKYPLGHTTLTADESRELTRQWTRRYLREQMVMELAGRAAEEMVYGEEDVSTINQNRFAMARRIAKKLVVSEGLECEALGTAPVPFVRSIRQSDKTLYLAIPDYVTSETVTRADRVVGDILDNARAEARSLMERNRGALDALVEALVARGTLSGAEVREIVAREGDAGDVEAHRGARAENVLL